MTNWWASSSTDGKLKMWVYGVAAGAFVLLIFIVSMIYLAWWVDEFYLQYFSSTPILKPNRLSLLSIPPPWVHPSPSFISLASFLYHFFCFLYAFAIREQQPLCQGTSLFKGPRIWRQRDGGVEWPELSWDGLYLSRVPRAGSKQ